MSSMQGVCEGDGQMNEKPLGFYVLTYSELHKFLNLPEDISIEKVIVKDEISEAVFILLTGENKGLKLVKEGYAIPMVSVIRETRIE
jgi:hypothetical protein